ncbi:MAG TPA: hypothetical protein DEV81_05900 [Cyanobacteria bacterium UBA11049]|nr:hypothetical protein [Cyanobacteria bacterium UBA11049]
MYTTPTDAQAIALTDTKLGSRSPSQSQNATNKPLRTIQRKAKYHDKNRIRYQEMKKMALRSCGCTSSKEVKKYLQRLGYNLDLRLTAAWMGIFRELAPQIEQLKIADTQHEPPKSIDFARRTQEVYRERKLPAPQAPRYNRFLEQIFATYCR